MSPRPRPAGWNPVRDCLSVERACPHHLPCFSAARRGTVPMGVANRRAAEKQKRGCWGVCYRQGIPNGISASNALDRGGRSGGMRKNSLFLNRCPPPGRNILRLVTFRAAPTPFQERSQVCHTFHSTGSVSKIAITLQTPLSLSQVQWRVRLHSVRRPRVRTVPPGPAPPRRPTPEEHLWCSGRRLGVAALVVTPPPPRSLRRPS